VKRIFDPIHHFIELDGAEVALLDAPALQRLRRLRQLGLASLAYPSAEHTRFGHVLGALQAGERSLASLRKHSPEYFSDERDYGAQRKLLRASLLLHDAGHGPFSHACEAVLGKRHEARTAEILALPQIAAPLAAIGVDARDVLDLIAGGGAARYPVLKELVSGPNLDADRMDYLLRDSYFTGVAGGRYDVEQLITSLRVFERGGKPVLGVAGRGVVALEGFVLARYMMFASVYFHHTTRAFERTLHEALARIWPDPRALDPVAEFLEWDDVRVLDALRREGGEAARALRERRTLFALAAEFNAAADLRTFDACSAALAARFPGAVWADAQEQLLHRLPLGADAGDPTVIVRTSAGLADARDASDLIRRLSGKAYWRKLFVRRSAADVEGARRLCREIAVPAECAI
jgi:HD superfamily phosphohydrolase